MRLLHEYTTHRFSIDLDRASSGVYQDLGIPALETWLASALATPYTLESRLIPDEQPLIEQTLCELVDERGCHLR